MRNFRKNTRHILGGESLFYCNNSIPNFVIYTKANIFFFTKFSFLLLPLIYHLYHGAGLIGSAVRSSKLFYALYTVFLVNIIFTHTH